MRQNAIFPHYGHDVGRNGHGTEIEQFVESVELNAIDRCKSLHKLESHTATREMRVGIAVVAAFGVENSHCRRQHFVGHVVVADDEINAEFFGISYFLIGLDAAVEHNDEAHSHFGRKLHTLARHAITLVIAVGDVVVDVGIVVMDKLIDQSHRSHSVHVVVAIDHNPLFACNGRVEAVDCHLHIVHQERIVQVGELRTEKTPRFKRRIDAAFAQHLSEHRMHAHLCSKSGSFVGFFERGRVVVPLIYHSAGAFVGKR